MKTEIEERQYKRFLVLYNLYKETKGDTNKIVRLKDISDNVGVKNGVFDEAKGYLKDEGFIKTNNSGESISHDGKKAVELAVNYPEDRSIHFPSYKDMGI